MFKPFKQGISFKYTDAITSVNIRRDVTLSDEAVNRITTAIMTEVNMLQELTQGSGIPEEISITPNWSVRPPLRNVVYLTTKTNQFIKIKFPDNCTPQEVLTHLRELTEMYEKEVAETVKSLNADLSSVATVPADQGSTPSGNPPGLENLVKSTNGVIQAQNVAASMASAMQKALDEQRPSYKVVPMDLLSIKPNKLVFWACDCGKSFICKAENIGDACTCGKPIEKTQKMWYPLESVCVNCGQPAFGFGVAGFTEMKCKNCESPVDVVFKRSKLYGGSKM